MKHKEQHKLPFLRLLSEEKESWQIKIHHSSLAFGKESYVHYMGKIFFVFYIWHFDWCSTISCVLSGERVAQACRGSLWLCKEAHLHKRKPATCTSYLSCCLTQYTSSKYDRCVDLEKSPCATALLLSSCNWVIDETLPHSRTSFASLHFFFVRTCMALCITLIQTIPTNSQTQNYIQF